MQIQRVLDAVHEPITLDDVKAHARLTLDDDDPLLGTLMAAARHAVETYTRRACCTQTWEATYDAADLSADRRVLTLPPAPLRTVVSIVSYAPNGSGPTVFPPAQYLVDTRADPGRVGLVAGATWPLPIRELAGLVVTYTVGYSDDERGVPPLLRQAVAMMTAYLYEHRGDEPDARLATVGLPLSIMTMLAGARTWHL